jgi:ribonuclease HI
MLHNIGINIDKNILLYIIMQKKVNKMFEKYVPKPDPVEVQPKDEYEYTMFFDGCCKGNPGKGGAGAVIYKNGTEIWAQAIYVGDMCTNNISEYVGLILGLQQAKNMNIKTLFVKGDSQLVIKQMKGEYKVSSPNIMDPHNDAKSIAKFFDKIEFQHVYRTFNKRADELSNFGLNYKTPLY